MAVPAIGSTLLKIKLPRALPTVKKPDNLVLIIDAGKYGCVRPDDTKGDLLSSRVVGTD
jgi:hypothetical protein